MNELAARLAPLFLSAVAVQAILNHFGGGLCHVPTSLSMEKDDEEEGDDIDAEAQ